MREHMIAKRPSTVFVFMAICLFWGIGLGRVHGEWPAIRYPGKADLPTPENLEKWLEGKEVIEVWFEGAQKRVPKFQDSLAVKSDRKADFQLSVGEGRLGSFVHVHMKVTPENIRRLLAIQAELAPRGYVLDAKGARVWAYQGDAKTREQARQLVPEVLASIEQSIKRVLPGAESTADKNTEPGFVGGFGYKLPGTDVKGFVRVDTTDEHRRNYPNLPEQVLHCPRLGLIVTQYYIRPAVGRFDLDSPQRQAIRRAFRENVGLFLKLEPGAGTWDLPLLKPDVGTAAATLPTPETLEKWLEGKGLIEIVFGSPQKGIPKFLDSLTVKSDNRANFLLTPGEGGGRGSFVSVCMKVTPENVRRLLALQAELAPRGYILDAKVAQVWSYQGDAKTREQAHKLVPEVLASVQQAIKQAVPGAECTAEKPIGPGYLGGFRYELQGTDVKGLVHVHNITEHRWGLAVIADQKLHLPQLGLMVQQYFRPGQPGGLDDKSPEHKAVQRAFKEQVEPLLKLEPGAAVTNSLPQSL